MIGFKLFGIRAGTLPARIGLANGDLIRSINGLDLTSADRALEIYTKLRGAAELAFAIERAGAPLTFKLKIGK